MLGVQLVFEEALFPAIALLPAARRNSEKHCVLRSLGGLGSPGKVASVGARRSGLRLHCADCHL